MVINFILYVRPGLRFGCKCEYLSNFCTGFPSEQSGEGVKGLQHLVNSLDVFIIATSETLHSGHTHISAEDLIAGLSLPGAARIRTAHSRRRQSGQLRPSELTSVELSLSPFCSPISNQPPLLKRGTQAVGRPETRQVAD